jgi:hypothetical protein
MTTPSRRSEIARQRVRKEKVALLRKRYASASSEADRSKITEKLQRVAPELPLAEFLKPLEKKQA